MLVLYWNFDIKSCSKILFLFLVFDFRKYWFYREKISVFFRGALNEFLHGDMYVHLWCACRMYIRIYVYVVAQLGLSTTRTYTRSQNSELLAGLLRKRLFDVEWINTELDTHVPVREVYRHSWSPPTLSLLVPFSLTHRCVVANSVVTNKTLLAFISEILWAIWGKWLCYTIVMLVELIPTAIVTWFCVIDLIGRGASVRPWPRWIPDKILVGLL